MSQFELWDFLEYPTRLDNSRVSSISISISSWAPSWVDFYIFGMIKIGIEPQSPALMATSRYKELQSYNVSIVFEVRHYSGDFTIYPELWEIHWSMCTYRSSIFGLNPFSVHTLDLNLTEKSSLLLQKLIS